MKIRYLQYCYYYLVVVVTRLGSERIRIIDTNKMIILQFDVSFQIFYINILLTICSTENVRLITSCSNLKIMDKFIFVGYYCY